MDGLKITEQDLGIEKKIPPSPQRNVLLNPDKNLWITLGVPTEDVSKAQEIPIPTSPHVFTVDELLVNDKNHNNFKLSEVAVILAHGYMVNNRWEFTNGQSIAETVEEYNNYAQINNLPKVEFVVACSGAGEQPLPEGEIHIGQFDARTPIAYAVGNTIQVGARITPEGKVTMSVGSNTSPFWGLDQLEVSRSIKIG